MGNDKGGQAPPRSLRGARLNTRCGGARVAIAAVAAVFLLAAPAVHADPQSGTVIGTCHIDVARDRATINVTVENATSEALRELNPGDLSGTQVGSASIFLNTYPRIWHSLLPGKTTTFKWTGELFGDGFLDLSAVVSVEFADGGLGSTGIINCNRLAVGDTSNVTPPTNTPRRTDVPEATPTRTERPTNTVRPTSTRRPTSTLRPTRTRVPTSTRRATRTPIPSSTPRPTRTRPAPRETPTPRFTATERPTRTPIPPRPTRTRIFTSTPRPTRTPFLGRATRTPIPQRPTRTRVPTSTRRPTRTPRGGAGIPTPDNDPPGGLPELTALGGSCSLRQTNDLVSVTFVLHNYSGVDLTGVRASIELEPEGGALFFDRTGPNPSLVPALDEGHSVTFRFSGRISDIGAMGFAVSAVGTDSFGRRIGSGLVDCGVASTDAGTFDGNGFTGDCSIVPGETGELRFAVRNNSGETLLNVEPLYEGASSTGTAQINRVRGPGPRSVRQMNVGQGREFVWSADVRGNGRVATRFRAEGIRTNGTRVSTGTVTCDVLLSSDGALPDLTVDQRDLSASWIVQTQNFGANHCAVFEGCVSGTGPRKLLKFNTTTPNLGPGDAFIGNPLTNPSMIFSECHQHYHFQDYADYRLLDMQGRLVARGHKQAFCLVDLYRPPGSTGSDQPRFPSCSFQGISAGWADIYHRDLDCQWIDITGVPDGRYVLEVHVNPARVIEEANYSNNVARTEVCIGNCD